MLPRIAVFRVAAVAILAAMAGLLCVPALAAQPEKGVLDTLTVTPTTGSGNLQSQSHAQHLQQQAARNKALREERKRLRKLNRRQLLKLAEQGERAAQLVLAENFAEEAHQNSITIISANDALSDAAYWYSLAAQRGYPGSPRIDGVLPAIPMRPVRSANN